MTKWDYHEFMLVEWQFYPTFGKPWLKVYPATEDGPMEVYFGFACFQFYGHCYGVKLHA